MAYKPIISQEELQRQADEIRLQHEAAELERIRIEEEAKGLINEQPANPS